MTEQKLTRKELYNLVWSTSLTALAKNYAISDVGLRKICVKHDIPLPGQGYRAKMQFNVPAGKIKLNKKYSGENEITLRLREEGDQTLQSLYKLEKDILLKEGQKLSVPEILKNPHELIISARKSFAQNPRSQYNEEIPRIPSCNLDIRVTNKLVERALKFMDTLIKVLENRGHKLSVDERKTFVEIYGESIAVSLREKLKRVNRNSSEDYSSNKYDFIPSGILSFNVEISYRTFEWADGKFPLEKKLARIIAKIELQGEKLKKTGNSANSKLLFRMSANV